MKRNTFLCLVVLITFFSSFNNLVIAQDQGVVIRILDGDTMDVKLRNDSIVRVRLLGIDAPEKKQEYGKNASLYVASICMYKDVIIEGTEIDKYGRRLANLRLLSSDTSVNALMVKNGMAWHYKRYSTDQLLSSLESNAQRNNKGLWSSKSPLPPWEWRIANK